MHIGLLAPPWIPIPPPAYGGIEQVVALQAKSLVAAGHDVTMVAAPGSRVEGVRVLSSLATLPAMIGSAHEEWLHVLPALEDLRDCDVIIEHSGPLGAMLAAQDLTPTLHVVHGPVNGPLACIYEGIARRASRLRLVAISHAQRRLAAHLPFVGVCHNGIDLDQAPFRERSEGYLVFLGRMGHEKGAATAIHIARRAGLPIKLAAKCREPAEREYFERYVAPELGPDVTWLGELGPDEKYALLGGALGLVFPIDWEEPFGMVMLEAMACGTPVLATPRGSVPEVVPDGVTGFVRATEDELVRAAKRLPEIDREACRRHVAERFSGDAMAAAYADVISRVLRGEVDERVHARQGAPVALGA